MKQAVVLFMLLLPLSVFAENRGGMSEAQMQQMMQQAQGMAACMQNVDQAEMQAFEQRAKQISADTKALCTSGKRDEAMQLAMAFGKEMSSNKAMLAMKKCGDGMKNMMPKIAAAAQNDEPGKSGLHVCDEL
ncbi:MAG: hypothetical protein Q8L15_12915 [Methylobacter sp.]|nr:hypothetical protein [Methylobacter sp.]